MLNLYQLEQNIAARMKATHVPGLALAIVEGQEVIYAQGFGVTSVEDGGLPVTPQTLFRIGSTTKPLTGSAIMRLVEAGKLDLDQPVRSYIDWFTLQDKRAADIITLRMLLSHTAGFPPAADDFGQHDPEGLEAFIRDQVAHYRLVAPPGTSLTYSNPGIGLAGYVAEIADGKHYVELMQELVFEPLQMKRTTFDPTVAMTYPLAQAHKLDKDKQLSVQHRFFDNVALYPAGFAISTVLDLANFAIMQMNQGRFQGQQVLAPESVRLMHTVQADLYTVKGTGYGLTFFTGNYKGVRLVWHDGGISTFACKFVMAPESGIAVVMLFNRIGLDYESIASGILDQLLELPEKESEPQAMEPERALWPQYVGSYVGRWVGLAIIKAVDEQLTLALNGELMPLHALKKDLYFGRRSESKAIVSVGFLLVEEGPPQFMYIDTYVLARDDAVSSFQADPSDWAAYTGTYALARYDTFAVRIRDNHLFIYSESEDEEVMCIPLSRTRFATKWCVFDFHLDEDGVASVLEYGELRKFPRVPGTLEAK